MAQWELDHPTVPADIADLARAGRLPQHLAVIMDGNGRWATRRGLSRSDGHRAGAESVRLATRFCRRIGLKCLTLYAFSEQNWGRPADEVQALLALLVEFLRNELGELQRNDIRLVAIGNLDRLPAPVRFALQHTMAATAQHGSMTLALCLSYGGREEIVQAARKLAQRVEDGDLDARDIDERAVDAAMWTAILPCPPDLIVRTSGEQRLSNFLLWQAAYAELYFADADWPDVREPDLADAMRAYVRRERRFGGIEAVVPTT
jgi:undecaprenyl diphosphate synthase